MRLIFYFLIVVPVCHVSAQVLRADHIIDRNSGGFIEFDSRDTREVESVYINENWLTGDVTLASGEIKGFPLRYDLKNNVLELKASDGIKIAKMNVLNSFTLFENDDRKQYRILKEHAISGLVEILVEGDASLLSRPYLEVIPANYNAALNIGSPTDRYNVKYKYFVLRNKEAVEIPKSTKNLIEWLGQYAEEMNRYIDENRLSCKKKADLIEMITHFNELQARP